MATKGDLEGFDLRHGLGTKEVDRQLFRAIRAGEVGARASSFFLIDMADRGLYQELGYSTLESYAELRLGLARSTLREYLSIGRALEELPLIDEALQKGQLFWSCVRVLARIAKPETEAAWVAWAEGRTAREVQRQSSQRDKGDLPTDPARRRIGTAKLAVKAMLSVVDWGLWSNARAKLEAESGGSVTDREMMLEAARLLLASRPDGTVPGRQPVNDSFYRVVVNHDPAKGTTELQTEDGGVELDDQTAREVLREAGRDDLNEPIPDDAGENDGPEVPLEERAKPTPESLRVRVLDRDGRRCVCCGSKKGLTVHHKKWRRVGGPTNEGNLMVCCIECHTLIHERLLVVRGRIPDRLRFADRTGRELGDRSDLAGELDALPIGATDPADARASPGGRRVRLRDVPAEVGPDWWQRHRHLFQWNERVGCFEFEDGLPNDAPAEVPPRRTEAGSGDARASRPAKLADVIGQTQAVRNLAAGVRGARALDEPVPHILLSGPPGLGKTSLALAVATEMGAGFRAISAPVVKEPSTLLEQLTSLRQGSPGHGDVLFLDEIHALPVKVCETLYEAMEDGSLSLPVRCGPEHRTVRIVLPQFTLIGATTNEHKLPEPMRARFGIQERLAFYVQEELVAILHRAADRAGIGLEDAAAELVASVARDTPRDALRLFRNVRADAADARASRIDVQLVAGTLARLGIDEHGLLPHERRLLQILRQAGRPLGLTTLAKRLGESIPTLQEVYEPYLVRRGFIRLTQFGRVAAEPPVAKRPAAMAVASVS